ncbi:hypothetical protein SRIMM317S_03182 [Streptomyces rimosus subsp. rimosus]
MTTEEKSKVAETLAEYRGDFRYNLLDANLRRFNAQVPTIIQWDDHEVRNNWYPGQILDDARYTEKNVDVLAARSLRAFREYFPIRTLPLGPGGSTGCCATGRCWTCSCWTCARTATPIPPTGSPTTGRASSAPSSWPG